MRRDLTAAVPVPRLMPLGNSHYLISHLKIKELAVLQRWIVGHAPDPIEARLTDVFADKVKRRELVALHDACSAWPPPPGSSEAETLLYTEEGLRLFLTLLISRHQKVEADEIAGVAGLITARQWDALRYHAFAGNSLDILYRRIDPIGARMADDARAGGRERRPRNWPGEFADLYEKFGKGTLPGEFFNSLSDLELPQYFALLGDRDDDGYTEVADANLKKEAKRRWACWNDFSDEEGPTADGNLSDGTG